MSELKALSPAPEVALRSTVLVVDDIAENLMVLGELLSDEFHVRVANCGEQALQAALITPAPSLILLDVMMPDLDGYQVLQRLQADEATRQIPVIFVSAMGRVEDEERGLSMGAVDYVNKPFNPSVVLARVRTHVELKAARDRLATDRRWLQAEVERRTRHSALVQDLSLQAMAYLAEARDQESGKHIVRTQTYVRLLATALCDHERFAPALRDGRLEQVVKAAPLHDVGKVGIPDAILCKPGRLTADEFECMKSHARIGADALDRAIAQTRQSSQDFDAALLEEVCGFLQVGCEIALCHHEKWDGSGYPAGLRGDAIPVSARLMALADVFDALMCKRVYKPALSFNETCSIIAAGRGSHFDPAVVDAFQACLPEFEAVALRFADPD
ncbi:response regulator [Duganella sp. FT3S]|uniref:Response regulator n=1 Tax=Rugamonas fusca TaxID=2758568 RepID=A0A7W2EKZ5_9BURK|nr:HD domain-containing phosphohydrolase [Rugamonas fusca]MBA5607737.1 response regulator [Rugamonas fusca]